MIVVAIDFDGTVVEHKFPAIGKDIGAQVWLKEFIANGALLVLNTMRSDGALNDAVTWFKTNEIELFGINNNPDQKMWTNSPKVYAQLYIDDAAFGCPLVNGYADWSIIGPKVLEKVKARNIYK